MLRFLTRRLVKRVHTHDENLNLREIVFGFNDGLVTTFTVVAGFTGALVSPRLIILAGVLNAISDGLSMAFGAWLSTKSEAEQYAAVVQDEEESLEKQRAWEEEELARVLMEKGFSRREAHHLAGELLKDTRVGARILAEDVRGMRMAEQHTPLRDGVFMFLAFLLGASIPLIPYFFGLRNAFLLSVLASLTAAFMIGVIKTRITRRHWFSSGVESLLIAGFLLLTAYGLGMLIDKLLP